jgi:uncharacterized membrane protein HdeD (DUF308 family)
MMKGTVMFNLFQVLTVLVMYWLFSTNAVSIWLFGLFLIESGIATVFFFARFKPSKAVTV